MEATETRRLNQTMATSAAKFVYYGIGVGARQGLAGRYFPRLWTSLSRGSSHQSLAAKPTQLTVQTTLIANHSQKYFPQHNFHIHGQEEDDKVW